jgi:hypothetical protein
MSKKEQEEMQVGSEPWYAVGRTMVAGSLLIVVVVLVMMIVEYFGTVVTSWLLK